MGSKSRVVRLKTTSWLAPETMDMGDPRRSRGLPLKDAGDLLPWVTRYLSCISIWTSLDFSAGVPSPAQMALMRCLSGPIPSSSGSVFEPSRLLDCVDRVSCVSANICAGIVPSIETLSVVRMTGSDWACSRDASSYSCARCGRSRRGFSDVSLPLRVSCRWTGRGCCTI